MPPKDEQAVEFNIFWIDANPKILTLCKLSKIFLKMLSNANECLHLWVEGLCCDICSNGSHLEYNFLKKSAHQICRNFDSQKITKKIKSAFLGGIFTRFFELLEKFHNRKCLGLWAQNMCHVVKLTFSDLVEIPNFEHFEFCPKFWLKMFNNANEWYSYYLKVFVVIFEPKEAALNIIFF